MAAAESAHRARHDYRLGVPRPDFGQAGCFVIADNLAPLAPVRIAHNDLPNARLTVLAWATFVAGLLHGFPHKDSSVRNGVHAFCGSSHDLTRRPSVSNVGVTGRVVLTTVNVINFRFSCIACFRLVAI